MPIYKKRNKISEDEFIAHVDGSYGQLEPIERALNCTRQAIRDLLTEKPHLQKELDDEMEREKDRIIIATMRDCKSEDDRTRNKAREIFLKAAARDRGFGDKLEVTGADGAPLVFLHTAAQLPDRNVWQIQADSYAENEDAKIEAEMEKIGIGGTPQRKIECQ